MKCQILLAPGTFCILAFPFFIPVSLWQSWRFLVLGSLISSTKVIDILSEGDFTGLVTNVESSRSYFQPGLWPQHSHAWWICGMSILHKTEVSIPNPTPLCFQKWHLTQPDKAPRVQPYSHLYATFSTCLLASSVGSFPNIPTESSSCHLSSFCQHMELSASGDMWHLSSFPGLPFGAKAQPMCMAKIQTRLAYYLAQNLLGTSHFFQNNSQSLTMTMSVCPTCSSRYMSAHHGFQHSSLSFVHFSLQILM